MFRLLGFLLGSAASIIAIVLLLGMPEFHLSKSADDVRRFDAAMEKLKEKQQLAEELVSEAAPAPNTREAPPEAIPELADEATPPTGQLANVQFTPETDPMAVTSEEFELPPAFLPPPDIQGEASWYAFWNPFRSEIAARGFVAQLEKVTGLDYRIVKVRVGVYQVAFEYADDQQRQARLSQIQAATGLDLSGT